MRDEYIDRLIEASSLGTPTAKTLRDSVDDESVERILGRVNAIDADSSCPNCDGVKCMGCVFREPGHDCVEDCPNCGAGPS